VAELAIHFKNCFLFPVFGFVSVESLRYFLKKATIAPKFHAHIDIAEPANDDNRFVMDSPKKPPPSRLKVVLPKFHNMTAHMAS
jgi:hypothetical protein